MIIFEKRPTPNPTNWEKLTVTEMANTMRDMDSAGEPVTPENLLLRGYCSAHISKYGLRAASLARKLSVKVVQPCAI